MTLEEKCNFINQNILDYNSKKFIFYIVNIIVIFVFFCIFMFGLFIVLFYTNIFHFTGLYIFYKVDVLSNGGFYNTQGNDIFTAVFFFLVVGFIGLRYTSVGFIKDVYYSLLLRRGKYNLSFNVEETELAVNFLDNLPINKEEFKSKMSDEKMRKILLIFLQMGFIRKEKKIIKQSDGFKLIYHND